MGPHMQNGPLTLSQGHVRVQARIYARRYPCDPAHRYTNLGTQRMAQLTGRHNNLIDVSIGNEFVRMAEPSVPTAAYLEVVRDCTAPLVESNRQSAIDQNCIWLQYPHRAPASDEPCQTSVDMAASRRPAEGNYSRVRAQAEHRMDFGHVTRHVAHDDHFVTKIYQLFRK